MHISYSLQLHKSGYWIDVLNKKEKHLNGPDLKTLCVHQIVHDRNSHDRNVKCNRLIPSDLIDSDYSPQSEGFGGNMYYNTLDYSGTLR